MTELSSDVMAAIRDVPDFPSPGILFKDITPVLSDAALYRRVLDWFGEAAKGAGADVVVGIESRGFLFGTPLVDRLDVGFVPVRKPGKLPWETISVDYTLEYGEGRLEVHTDVIKPGTRVVVVDDLLATGGTARATVDLVRRLGGEVTACVFLVELGFLGGREHLDCPVEALVRY